MARTPPEPAVGALDLATVLHALGDPVRLELIRRLATGDEVGCGAPDLCVPKSTLSNHWRTLRDAGLTSTRVEGRNRWMTLRRADLEARFPGLLDAVLTVAGPSDR
ncbi:helix-turn-helix transcriptional regulator [Actinoallomurus sp. NPDC052274]|uniref:ArsR/SmtB family transcription factor n=1 Tax=Actinoallomurus sp. NPDC052274 TaxID=3155420 RepID=UPI0034387A78